MSSHMPQIGQQGVEISVGECPPVEAGHLRMRPPSQRLRITNVRAQQVGAQVLGGVVWNVQVRSELRVSYAVERMTGKTAALEDCHATPDRAADRNAGIRQDRRKARSDAAELVDRGQLLRSLLGADPGGLRLGPYDVERPGAALLTR